MTTTALPHTTSTFEHEAVFYDGAEDFVSQTAPFLRQGADAGEAMLVVVSSEKIISLRAALGAGAERVRFADMADIGHNPARIIPAWRDFVSENATTGRGMRGIGEPIWRERDPAALVECQIHESLLNVAFGPVPGWRLLCPYDTTTLDPAVLREARRSHPHVGRDGKRRRSRSYRGIDASSAPFGRPLPQPPAGSVEFPILLGELDELRRLADRHAAEASLDPARRSDFVLATNELATNSLRHGGGHGAVRMWTTDDAVFAEVRDAGRFLDPMVGRHRPEAHQESGFGLWLVNQLCDLVQIREIGDEAVVRIRIARPPLNGAASE